MRSGNGRHRRPRQAPAIVVAAGVTGASIAMPLLAATGAHAADSETWDRVAECESGGMWSADTGNGFYGGLQLTLDMWKDYGGTAYAPRPDLASRSQQITVAENMLADTGPEGWPRCALNAGLTEDGQAPDVNPGRTESPAPEPSEKPTDGPTGTPDDDSSGSSKSRDGADGSRDSDDSADSDDARKPGDDERNTPSSGSDAKPGKDGDGSGEDGAKPDPDPSGDKGGEHGEPGKGDEDGKTGDSGHGTDQDQGKGEHSTPAPGSGKHRGPSDDRTEKDGDRPAGRHASRGEGRQTPVEHGPADYTVRPGDNLSAIAEEHEVAGGWPALYEANESVIGDDPDLILPGQELVLDGEK